MTPSASGAPVRPSRRPSVLLVGAGLASAWCAHTLRARGFDGRITIVGEEPHAPYQRPPLSKDFLAGRQTADALAVHHPEWYADHDVEVVTGTAVLDLGADDRTAVLADGRRLPWTTALLATGSHARRLPPDRDAPDGVHRLRTRADAEGLRAALAGEARKVVVLGGGWVGFEAAGTARGAGHDVTVLERDATLLDAALATSQAPAVGRLFSDLHTGHGVRLLHRTGLERLDVHGGRLAGVRTTAGERLDADVLVVGIGAAPNVALARDAGLAVDDGVVVDAHLRTARPDVLAAGDVARAAHPFYDRHLRVEHWDNAKAGGIVAARTILGEDAVHDRIPYFFSDQYRLGLEFTGHLGGGYDEVVVRGDLAAAEAVVFWLRSGRVVAGMNVNVWDVTDGIERLIRSRATVDPARLRDPDTPLEEVVPAPRDRAVDRNVPADAPVVTTASPAHG